MKLSVIFLAMLCAACYGDPAANPQNEAASGPDAQATARLVAEVRKFVHEQSPDAALFVRLNPVSVQPSPTNAVALLPGAYLDVERLQRDYPDKVLYLLVQRPEPMDRAEPMSKNFVELYHLGIRNTLFLRDWGDLRLFEIVRPPLRSPKRGGE